MNVKCLSIIIATLFCIVTLPSGAYAACGYWAFGGAFKSLNSAKRQARKVDADVFDLDQSNSPNAGKGYYVVALGVGSRSDAKRWRRMLRRRGVSGAYVANRCLDGGTLN